MRLTADTCLTADIGVVSSILTRSHYNEIISMAIFLPSTEEGLLSGTGVSIVHEALVNLLVKLAPE